MNLVFIAHFFPPMNSTGARRAVAMAKYIADAGHHVTVLTTTKSAAHGPLTEAPPRGVRVVEIPHETSVPPNRSEAQGSSAALRPRRLGRIKRRLGRVLSRLFGQLFERQIVFAIRLVRDARIARILADTDAVISTSPPWVVHAAAARLARRHDVVWVADYRDQFSGSHLSAGSVLSRPVERALDRQLARRADAVTTVSPAMRDYYKNWSPHVELIYNGFDEEEVRSAVAGRPSVPGEEESVVVRHVGKYPVQRPPLAVFEALTRLPADSTVVVEFVGKDSDQAALDVVRLAPAAAERVRVRPQVSHHGALRAMGDAEALLLLETWNPAASSHRGVVTTKVFEHLALAKPTLAAVTTGTAAADILRGAGLLLAETTSPDEIAQVLNELSSGAAVCHPNVEYVAQFSRRAQADQMVTLVRSIIDTRRKSYGGG